jgi:methionine transaminase
VKSVQIHYDLICETEFLLILPLPDKTKVIMKNYQWPVGSKLPNMGTSIFAVMSLLAAENKAINLSQGFPDFPISEKLISLVHKYMKKGFNQYAPMPGVLQLRKAISKKIEKSYGAHYDPNNEITITAGATQAIFSIISAFVRPEDEVIIFEPAYDSYVPSVKINGGLVKYATLQQPGFKIDWERFPALISNRTRMIIINTPHNPSGTVLNKEDIHQLNRITKNRDIIILSDEVYEHLIFDGLPHESICKYPDLASKSLVVGSFGKTFHATGWKTGFVVAPENLTAELRKTHQFIVFAANTPIQHAIAEFLEDEENYNHLPDFYQQKRDFFLELIKGSKFKPLTCSGTYFLTVDYSAISDESEMDFAVRLTKEKKIASVPLSPFYHKNDNNFHLRFCFAKTDETLEKAAQILCKI